MTRLVGGLALCALALLTSRRVPVWQSDLTLWSDAVTHAKEKPRPAVNLAAAVIVAGDLDRGEALLLHANELAQARTGWEREHTPDLVYADLGVIRLRQGRITEATVYLADHALGNQQFTAERQAVCVRYGLCPELVPR